MRPAYHSIVVSLVTGLFFFAMLAVLLRLVLRWQGKDDSPLAVAADRAALAAAGLGVALTVVGIVTGFTIWPLEATLRSSLMKNKILTAFLVLAFWGSYFAVRLRRGPEMWHSMAMSVYAFMLAASGFAFGLITNSIGGDAAGNPSGFEGIVRIFGVETRSTFYLPTWLNLAIIVLGIAAVVIAFTGRADEGRRIGEPRV
jgi:hypothetical protein